MTIDLEQAKLDPGSVFRTVDELVSNQELTKQEKIDLLERWVYDEKELTVAEEENMPGTNNGEASKLDDILKALQELKEN